MKQRQPKETDAHYIKRLEDRNRSLQQDNYRRSKWAAALNEAITALSTDASLAFQAMAEKAGVRSHPSVTSVVKLFDMISHPQWRSDEPIPRINFPSFWDFDTPDAWSGDADMQLNSPIADAIDLIMALRFSAKKSAFDDINRVISGLERALQNGIQGLKDQRGFKPAKVSVPPPGHFRDMPEDSLRDLLSAVGWMALDLAQDMAFANECLRRDLRAATYRRICSDLYRLSQISMEVREDTKVDIKVLGAEQEKF